MLDPVLCEIVKNALLMVAQEAGIRAARSAGSTFVSASAEVACALFDATGRVIAQTEFGQMHISALRSMLQTRSAAASIRPMSARSVRSSMTARRRSIAA
jgi:N-methylhydantoinase B/oxoprolinase/acetone carboxylase alpha subunit